MNVLGMEVRVVIDRPLGSVHPKHPDILYTVNYGYIPDILGGDAQAQDVYLMGVEHPVESFTGVVIAVIHRLDDVEDKWVVAPKNRRFSEDEIQKATAFQEKYFTVKVLTDEHEVAKMPQRWRPLHSKSPHCGTWE